jgi:2-polyprenyl-3-methyl-5-hydroxy-6-metoxy-1,4-benzoquinol methylase
MFSLVECSDCGLRRRNPMPNESAIRNAYDLEYFQSEYRGGVEKTYIENENVYLREARQLIKIIKKYKQYGRLLEVGCAGGYVIKEIKRSDYDVVGIEMSKEMTDFAKNKLELNVINDDFQKIDFEKDTFDIVYSAHTMEHVSDPLQFLLKAKSIIRKDGILILELPVNFNYALISIILGVFKVVKNALGGNFKVKKQMFWYIAQAEKVSDKFPYHLYEFTPQTIKKLLHRAGFKIVLFKTFDAYPKQGKYPGIKSKILKSMNFITHWISYHIQLFNWGDRVLVVCKLP